MSLQVPELPAVIRQFTKVEELKVDEKSSENNKNQIVVILHTRDVGDYEENLCRKYGRVRHWNPTMANRDLSTVDTEYLFVDIRNKYARVSISKADVTKFKWCAYSNVWEKLDSHVYDDFVEDINILTKFPDLKCTYKEEYDDLLTEKKKIKSPSSCLSLLSFLVNIWNTVRKD